MPQTAPSVNPLGAPNDNENQTFLDNWAAHASNVIIGLRWPRSSAPTRAWQCATVQQAIAFAHDPKNAEAEVWASYASFVPLSVASTGKRSSLEAAIAKQHTNANVCAVDRFWFDIDVKAGGTTKSGAPCYETQEGALAAARYTFETLLGLEPTYVNSGGGIHVHVELDEAIDPQTWKALAASFTVAIAAQDVKLVADKSKFTVESAYMRLPGTYNLKPGLPPRPVYVISNGALHSRSEIEAILLPVTATVTGAMQAQAAVPAPTPTQAAAARAAKPRRALVRAGARDLEQLSEILPFLARTAKPGDTFNIFERDGCFRIACAIAVAVADGADPNYAVQVFLDTMAEVPEANAAYTVQDNLDLLEQASNQQERKDSEGARVGEKGGLLTTASVRRAAREVADRAGIPEHMRPETIIRTDKAAAYAQAPADPSPADPSPADPSPADPSLTTSIEVSDALDPAITAEGPALFKPKGYGTYKLAGAGLLADGMSQRFIPYLEGAKMFFYDLQERRELNSSALQYVTGLTDKQLKAWVPTVPQYKGTKSDISAPFGAIVDGAINTFSGLTVQSRPGNCDILLDMVYEVIANSNTDYYEWLIRYCAWLWQNPASNPGVAVVLHSEEEGTGKTSFAKILMKLFDPASQKVSQQKHVTGNFNSILEGVRILFAEESFFAGDHRVRGPLKDLITADSIVIERKNREPYSAPNRMAVIMASNEDFVVPAGPMARRFAVFDVSTHRARDREYWDKVHDAIDNPDVIAAFAYYCETIDLTGWRPASTVPTTDALIDQKVETAEGTIDGFMIQAMSMGIIYDDPTAQNPGVIANMKSGEWQDGAITLTGDHMNDLTRAANRYLGARNRTTRNKIVRRLKKIFGDAFKQRNAEGSYYVLPKLSAARAAMSAHMKGNIDWGDDGVPLSGKRPKLPQSHLSLVKK